MRIRKKKWAKPLLEEHTNKIVVGKETFFKRKLKDNFLIDQKLVLEIGVGKGDFISQMAANNNDLNFLGLEVEETVLGFALRKVIQLDLDNVRLAAIDANDMINVFNEKEVDIIRLNFSDPWPKKRHQERRLTSSKFLQLYEKILKDEGKLIIKTDNKNLFEFSIETLKEKGWVLRIVNENYPLTNNKEDVPTEYEKRFRELGQNIYYIEAIKKENRD